MISGEKVKYVIQIYEEDGLLTAALLDENLVPQDDYYTSAESLTGVVEGLLDLLATEGEPEL